MKTRTAFIPLTLTLLAGLVFTTTVSAASKAGEKPKPGTLEVQVNVPPNWRPMFEDRVSEAFVERVREVFRQRGFKGDIREVTAFDEPTEGCSLLYINLTEWRMDHIGNIDCTFTASIQTGGRSRHLGIYTNSALRWMSGSGRFGLSDSFEEAAEGAIRQLYDDLAKTELVPNLRKK